MTIDLALEAVERKEEEEEEDGGEEKSGAERMK